MKSNTVGQRLREARERKNLSQVQVCSHTGINNKNLSRYENGGSEPDLLTISQLATLYEVSVDWLLGKKPLELKEEQLLERNRIGPKLARARIKSGLSITEFADRIGSTIERVRAWENNRSVPSLSELKAISSLIDTPIDEIMLDGEELLFNGTKLPNEVQVAIRELITELTFIDDPKTMKRLIKMMKSMVQAFTAESE